MHAHDLTCGNGFSSLGRSNCHKQNGLCGTNHYSDNQAPTKTPWTKNPESNHIADIVSQGRSMTWGESLQCRIVRVGVSQCPTGGWRNHQDTNIFHIGPFDAQIRRSVFDLENHSTLFIFHLQFFDIESYSSLCCIRIRRWVFSTSSWSTFSTGIWNIPKHLL